MLALLFAGIWEVNQQMGALSVSAWCPHLAFLCLSKQTNKSQTPSHIYKPKRNKYLDVVYATLFFFKEILWYFLPDNKSDGKNTSLSTRLHSAASARPNAQMVFNTYLPIIHSLFINHLPCARYWQIHRIVCFFMPVPNLFLREREKYCGRQRNPNYWCNRRML